MSILLHLEIAEKYKKGKIVIEPFNATQIGPNSYDVRLGPTLKVYDFDALKDQNNRDYLDPFDKNPTKTIEIPPEGLILHPGTLYLGSTVEAVGSDHYLAMYEGRSSMARLGIQSHISAGFGDVGFKSNWTLEIVVTHPVKIRPGMRMGQIYFHRIRERANKPEFRYKGKYQHQKEPQESKGYYDVEAQMTINKI